MDSTPPPGSTNKPVTTPDSRRCDTCGAPLRFEPASVDLCCRHCRAAEAIAPATTGVGELAYETTVGPGASTDDEIEVVTLTCADCGAPSEYPPNTLSASCPFCRTPFVGTPTSTRTLTPAGVIPLSITDEQARAHTKGWLGNRWFAPRHLDKVATNALDGSYSPSWVFSMSSVADYRGRRGDNYQDTETHTTTDSNGNPTTETRTVTKIRWRSASGTVQLRFDGVTAYSGTGAITRFGPDLEPWGLDRMVPYADDYLRGTESQTYTAPPAAGLAQARERTTNAVEDAIRRDIGGDHQEISSVDRRDHDIGFRYVMLPGWEATYRHRDDTYFVAINGQTGKVAGTRPYSKVKIAIAVGMAVAVIGLAVFLLTRSSESPPAGTPTPTTVVGPTTTGEAITPTTVAPNASAPTTAVGLPAPLVTPVPAIVDDPSSASQPAPSANSP